MRLHFMRHATAASREEWGANDSTRPLTPEGERVAHAMAEELTLLKASPRVVLTSPYARARTTAAIAAEVLGGVPLREEPRLEPHLFSLDALQEVLAPFGGDDELLLVGHEPSMSEVISELAGGGRFALKKAGIARVDLMETDVRSGVLRWLVPPRILG